MQGVKRPDSNIDEGLWVLAMMQRRGEVHAPIPFEVQGAACGVSRERMRQIYESTMRKVRVKVHCTQGAEALLREYFHHSR
jgi:DNA-directed RNA polymerase sigma subunit (sigma70/sigma32)